MLHCISAGKQRCRRGDPPARYRLSIQVCNVNVCVLLALAPRGNMTVVTLTARTWTVAVRIDLAADIHIPTAKTHTL